MFNEKPKISVRVRGNETISNNYPQSVTPEGYFRSITGYYISAHGAFVSLAPDAFRPNGDGRFEPIKPQHQRGFGKGRMSGVVA